MSQRMSCRQVLGQLKPSDLVRLSSGDLVILNRIKLSEVGKPLHKRKIAGLPGDYKIIDESGITVWASEWCRQAYLETQPRGVWK